MAGNKSLGYGIAGAGFLIAWSALINRSVLGTIQDLVAGKKPTPGPGLSIDNTIPGNDIGLEGDAGSVTGNIQQTARRLLGIHGWQNQWTAFNTLEQGEGGWNPTATNPSSKAFGLAQALGHGTSATRGTLSNMYGGFGLSTSEAVQANSGSAEPQLKWMMNYIAAVYGNPTNALAKWQSRSTLR